MNFAARRLVIGSALIIAIALTAAVNLNMFRHGDSPGDKLELRATSIAEHGEKHHKTEDIAGGSTFPDFDDISPRGNVNKKTAANKTFLDTISDKNPLRVWTMNIGTKSEIISVLQKLLGLSTIMSRGQMKEIQSITGNPSKVLRTACPNPHRQRRLFFEGMRNKTEIRKAHLLYHEMVPGNTEFLMPFNKSIIYYLSTSPENGRENPIQIREWHRNIVRLSKDPWSAIVANNLYQLRKLQYFTGVNAHYIHPLSLYTNMVRWSKETVDFPKTAVIPDKTHGWYARAIYNVTNKILKKMGAKIRLRFIRDVFKTYKYHDLVKFPCNVFMPTTVSITSHFESYNMGIPTFFPSIDYMVKLESEGWATGFACSSRINWKGLPVVKGGPFVGKDCKLPDACTNPHDMKVSANERKAWWRLADFYQWKNVIYYDSPEDLAQKLVSTNFTDVAIRMQKEVKAYSVEAYARWRNLLTQILNPMPANGYHVSSKYYSAMKQRWNATRKELDESEEKAEAACKMYANGPGELKPGPKFVSL